MCGCSSGGMRNVSRGRPVVSPSGSLLRGIRSNGNVANPARQPKNLISAGKIVSAQSAKVERRGLAKDRREIERKRRLAIAKHKSG